MNGSTKVVLAFACLALAALACQAVTGGSKNTPVPIDTIAPIGTIVATENLPNPTQSGTGDVLLSDDFSSSKWGTGTDENSSIEYKNEALEVIVFKKNYFVWSTPNKQDYQNVHMEVTVLNNNTDLTTAFGLLCNQQASANSSYYYLAITPGGEYAIAKATENQNDVFLTNNNKWASSDSIAKNASSYQLGADCGNGTLTLYVDGKEIDSVSDSSYTDGGVGVMIWSGEKATNTDISFDDFLMTSLP